MSKEVGQVGFYITQDGPVRLDEATREQLIEWLIDMQKERDAFWEFNQELLDVIDKHKGDRDE